MVEERIIEILAELCGADEIKEDLDIDLFEEDYMDSLNFIELLIAIEENFKVTIAPTEVERDDVNTPRKIIELVQERIQK